METIYGVLIEGVDYVGKTTVARRLAERIGETSIEVSLGQCYLHRNRLIEFLEGEAKKSDDIGTRDLYYSTAIVADLATVKEVSGFRVQDRHWLTQVGRNAFFHPEEEIIPRGYLENNHIPFERNVLLTSTVAAKVDRASSRPALSPRDRYLAAHPEVNQEYESFLQNLLPQGEEWLLLDTSDRTPEEVADEILTFCRSARSTVAP